MANEQNLRPINKMSPEEKRAFQSKGGKAARRKLKEKRALRELLEICMAQPFVDAKGSPLRNPATGEELNIKEAMAVSLARKAAAGNLPAIRTAAELLGELEQTGMTGKLVIDCTES